MSARSGGSFPGPRRAGSKKEGSPLRHKRPTSAALRLVTVLGALALVGTLLLLLPGVTYKRLGFIEAMFTAVSAMTVTGLSTIVPSTDLTTAGKVLLAGLIQVGGIGTMTFVVIIFRLIGREISMLDRIHLRNALGGVETRGVLGLLARVLLGVIFFETIGALLLYLHWRPMFATAREALGYAVFHAISAFCNAGFELFTGDPRFADGLPSDGLSMIILSGLIITGGLGVPVIADLLAYRRHRRLTLHTRLTLGIVFFLIMLGGLGIFSAEMLTPDAVASEAHSAGATTKAAEEIKVPWTRELEVSFFHAVMARTAGFGIGVGKGFPSLSPASQFLTLLLMFIGAAPASMGGGITTGTVAALGIALVAQIRNRFEPTIGERAIPWDVVQRAAVVLVAALLVVTTATWLILVSHPGTGLIIALFEVISAFATCGLSLAFTPQLNGFGLAVIMVVMFWGRLGALTVVLALTRPSSPSLIRYPEEQILIG